MEKEPEIMYKKNVNSNYKIISEMCGVMYYSG